MLVLNLNGFDSTDLTIEFELVERNPACNTLVWRQHFSPRSRSHLFLDLSHTVHAANQNKDDLLFSTLRTLQEIAI